MKRLINILVLILIGTTSAFGWGREAHEVIARIAENNLKPGARLKQDFINAAMPLIETQMLYAGYRLAYVLNTLFR